MQRLFDQARIRNIAARAARRLPIHRLLFQGTAIGLYGAVRLARRACDTGLFQRSLIHWWW